jgi:predicted DNA-binding transcriptional regulator AlpA
MAIPRKLPANSPDDRKFLTAARIRDRYSGVSSMWIERAMERHGFPRPIVIGRLRFWSIADIEAYERAAAARGGVR